MMLQLRLIALCLSLLAIQGFKINHNELRGLEKPEAAGSDTNELGSDVAERSLSILDNEMRDLGEPDAATDLVAGPLNHAERRLSFFDAFQDLAPNNIARSMSLLDKESPNLAKPDAAGSDLTDASPDITKRGFSMLDLLSEITKRLGDVEEEVDEIKEGKKFDSCPDGWHRRGKSCYYFSRVGATWYDSLSFCMAFQGYLAEINDYSENVYLKQKVKSLNDNFWVGGTDLLKENHWIWVRSQTWMTTSVFSDWQRNEPNNRDGSEHCIDLRASASGQWNDEECHTSLRFICERELK